MCGATMYLDASGRSYCKYCEAAASTALPSYLAERRALEGARSRSLDAAERARRAGRRRALVLLVGSLVLAFIAWVGAAWYVSLPFILLAIAVVYAFATGALERNDEEAHEFLRSVEEIDARLTVVDRHISRLSGVAGPRDTGRLVG
jgi:hypothetical protein